MTRGDLMRAELGESLDHFLAAATHAASGVGGSVGPRATMIKGAAIRGLGSTAASLAPLATAYRVGAADATAAALKFKGRAAKRGKSMANRKMGMLVGLLGAGAALGAAGAMMARKRRMQQWSEYDPSAAMDAMSADARSMMKKASSKSGATMDKLSSRTSNAMDKTAERLQSAASSMRKNEYQNKPEQTM